MTYDVFISYSRKDSQYAEKIYDALEGAGIHCFIDRQGISGGADFPMVLADAILDSKVLLLVASEHAYASEFTQKELTYAVSNKGSRFIFPLIVDGSKMPAKLEFLLSDINWRELSLRYRIEKELVADIQQKLKNPHAGETLRQRERGTAKTFFFLILAIMFLGGGGVFWYLNNEAKKAERLAAEKERLEKEALQEAKDNVNLCKALIDTCKTRLRTADNLRDENRVFETFDTEVETLRSITPIANKVDSIVNVYTEGEKEQYRQRFATISTSFVRSRMEHKLDSMFKYWNQFAISNYQDYKSYHSRAFKDDALDCTNRALTIRPEDENLLNIKQYLMTK